MQFRRSKCFYSVQSWIRQCAAGAEFCTSNAVGYRRIHHQFTRLGKAYYSCETVHGFWVRARVAGGTFLSGILLGLNTVYMSPNAGGGRELRGLSQWEQLCTSRDHGAQINLGDLTPYLTYGCTVLQHIGGKNTPGFSNLYQMEHKLTRFKMETMAKTKNVGRWICSHEKS